LAPTASKSGGKLRRIAGWVVAGTRGGRPGRSLPSSQPDGALASVLAEQFRLGTALAPFPSRMVKKWLRALKAIWSGSPVPRHRVWADETRTKNTGDVDRSADNREEDQNVGVADRRPDNG
jgi:hypothetical protein